MEEFNYIYKINLLDEVKSSFGNNNTILTLFSDDLEKFEKIWLSSAYEEDKHAYLKSKTDEIVNVSYIKDTNIFEGKVDVNIIFEQSHDLEDGIFMLANIYDCCHILHYNKANIKLKYISIDNDGILEYYLIDSYDLQGVCREFNENKNVHYSITRCYGNPILDFHIDRKSDDRSSTKDIFVNNTIKSCCYICLKQSNDNFLSEVEFGTIFNQALVMKLMRDIPDEIG